MRILIVRVGAMGDVLHALPAVAGLRRAMPDAFIGWAVEPKWKGLVSGTVDRVHEVRRGEWKAAPVSLGTARSVAELRRELRLERYDVCVDLQGSVRSGVIGWMAGAKRLVGAERPREGGVRWLYGERVEMREEGVIEQACELVGAAVCATIEPAGVEIARDSAAEQWCVEMLHETGVMRGFALLFPTAGWAAKEWPADKFAELAGRLDAAGLRVLVNGGTGSSRDEATVARVAAAGARVVRCSVAEMVALTRRAAVVVGGDTGPVHLAAALGRPTVALFGPTDPARNGPWFPGARARVLRDAGSRTSYKRQGGTEAGLRRISVEEVSAAVLGMLEEKLDG